MVVYFTSQKQLNTWWLQENNWILLALKVSTNETNHILGIKSHLKQYSTLVPDCFLNHFCSVQSIFLNHSFTLYVTPPI